MPQNENKNSKKVKSKCHVYLVARDELLYYNITNKIGQNVHMHKAHKQTYCHQVSI